MGDIQFNGTPEEWDALVKKNKEKEEPKQETIEELAERHHPIDVRFEYSEELLLRIKRRREYFIDGYKAAQERMYSKEEVVAIVFNTMDYNLTPDCIEQFFLEHLKKK